MHKMESAGHVSVPLRNGKKMKKRKELDALVANSVTKRSCVGGKRATVEGGISSQDQLLSESTDDQDDWLARVPKRPRTRMARRRACGSLFRACSAVLIFACIVATTTVLWLFIDIREQITALRSELDQVVASSQGVPDALQKCHTMSKNLQQNQTQISLQIMTLKLQLENITKEVSEVKTGLGKIQEKFNNVPEYLNMPQQISDVKATVANLGSQIKDLTTTVSMLKDTKGQMQTINGILQQNVTELRQSILRLQNTTQVPIVADHKNDAKIERIFKTIDGIQNNITTINSTLSHNVQWVRDDQKKDHKIIDKTLDTSQNMSARISTLEGICSKTSSDQILLQNNLNMQYNKSLILMSQVQSLTSQLPDLQTKYRQLLQNVTEISSVLHVLQQPPTLDQISPKPYDVTRMDTQKTEEAPSFTSPLPTSTAPSPKNKDKLTNGKPSILTTQ